MHLINSFISFFNGDSDLIFGFNVEPKNIFAFLSKKTFFEIFYFWIFSIFIINFYWVFKI